MSVKKIAAALYGYTGLQFDKKALTCFGTFEGYRCYLQFIPGQNSAVFTVPCAPRSVDAAADASQAEMVNNAMMQISKQSSKITGCIYKSKAVTASLNCGVGTSADTLTETLRLILDEIKRNSLFSGCTECGRPDNLSDMLINSTATAICPDCLTHVESALGQNQQMCAESSENVLLGVLGALMGAGILFLAVYLAWLAGFIAYITGALGLWASLWLYTKMAGKLSVKGGVICVVLCLCSAIFVSFFCVANTTAKFFADEYASGDFTPAYQAQCEQMLQNISKLNATTDSELEAAMESYTAQEARDYIAEMGAMAQEELDNCKFVAAHTDTWSCLIDLNSIAQWTTNGKKTIWSNIIENLLWGVISVGVAAIGIPSAIRKSNGKFTIRPLSAMD